MKNFVRFSSFFALIIIETAVISCLLFSWPGSGLAQNTSDSVKVDQPETAVGELRHFLPEQPQLSKFENGSMLRPDSDLEWTRIFDNTTGKEAQYVVLIIDPGTNEVVTHKNIESNRCRFRDLPMLSQLKDKGDYQLQVIAYRDTVNEIPPDERTQYRFGFDKYPGMETPLAEKQASRLLQPETGLGIKTGKGILLKWKPDLENHEWVIRIIKMSPSGEKTIVTYLKKVLPQSEYKIESGTLTPEDEDSKIEINIVSSAGVITPIETHFYINNTNQTPNQALLEKKEEHTIRWRGMGDPDNDQIVYRLIIEKIQSDTAVEPEMIRNVIIPSFGTLDLIDELERMVEYKCCIEAQDTRGLKKRSKAVYLKLDQPPAQPVCKVKTDRKKLAKAKKIFVTHENFDSRTPYKYYLKYFLKNGKIDPPDNRWYTESPTKAKKNRVELDLRRKGKNLTKVVIVVRASNIMGETAQSSRIIMGKTKKSATEREEIF